MRTLTTYSGDPPSLGTVQSRDTDYQSVLCIELGGRALAFASDDGYKFLRKYPWWNREHADAITGTICDWIRDDGVTP